MHDQSEFQCDPFQDRPAARTGQEWVEFMVCAFVCLEETLDHSTRTMPGCCGTYLLRGRCRAAKLHGTEFGAFRVLKTRSSCTSAL